LVEQDVIRSYKDGFQAVKRDENSPESAHNDVSNYLLLLGEAWTILRYNNNNNNNNKFGETIDYMILAKEQYIKGMIECVHNYASTYARKQGYNWTKNRGTIGQKQGYNWTKTLV